MTVSTDNSKTGIPTRNPYILAQSGVPVILPSSGSSNATGQITLTTALPYQPSGTVGLYLPAGVVTAGSQGTGAAVYQVTFSSTTVCQVAGTGITSANGAYTQVLTQQQLASVSVPGGSLGANGRLRVSTWWTHINSAGTKGESLNFGGSAMQAFGNTTTNAVFSSWDLQNKGAQNVNQRYNLNIPNTPTSAFSYPGIDTSTAQTLAWLGQLITVATDYIILEGYTVEVLPSP